MRSVRYVFPPKGTLITPEWPAATNARSFVLLRCIGLLAGVVAQAAMAACPPIRRQSAIPVFTASTATASRSCRGKFSAAVPAAAITVTATTPSTLCPDSRNQPAEFTETRFPLLVEKLALRTDSGGAGKRRGGLGYDKDYRALVDCRTIVTADRVRLGCYGVNGGKAGTPFCVTDRRRGQRRATWAAWSTASRCWPDRSCAS